MDVSDAMEEMLASVERLLSELATYAITTCILLRIVNLEDEEWATHIRDRTKRLETLATDAHCQMADYVYELKEGRK